MQSEILMNLWWRIPQSWSRRCWRWSGGFRGHRRRTPEESSSRTESRRESTSSLAVNWWLLLGFLQFERNISSHVRLDLWTKAKFISDFDMARSLSLSKSKPCGDDSLWRERTNCLWAERGGRKRRADSVGDQWPGSSLKLGLLCYALSCLSSYWCLLGILVFEQVPLENFALHRPVSQWCLRWSIYNFFGCILYLPCL